MQVATTTEEDFDMPKGKAGGSVETMFVAELMGAASRLNNEYCPLGRVGGGSVKPGSDGTKVKYERRREGEYKNRELTTSITCESTSCLVAMA